MSKREVNLFAGAVATVLSAILGTAFVLGVMVGAGVGLLVMTALFSALAGFVAYIELGGNV